MKRIFLLLIIVSFTSLVGAKCIPSKFSDEKLYARYEVSDSGTSMTLMQANKNAEAAKNKSNPYFPFYFSPLIIVIIALAVRRRKQREKKT